MANKALFAQLKQKFTTDTIIKRAGGKFLKVSDFNGIQAFGNLQQNTLANRYTRLYSNSSLIEPGIGYGMQITRAQLYLDYEAMDLDALVAPALDILCEEATQVNEMNNEILSIRSSSENIQDELYNLFYNVLNVEFNLPMWIRAFCKYGDFFLLLRLSDQFGVYGVKSLSPYEMVREEGLDANNGEYVRFIQDPGAIMGGISSINQSRNHRIYENYEIAHFRLMKDSNFLPYGRSWLEPGRKLFKAYTMMEDAAVTHRVTKSAEKRVFYYNVGNLPPNEVDAMMQKHISNQKRTPLFDHKTGQFNYKFNMMNLLEDFHIPVRNGDNLTRIDTAKGLEYTGMDDMNYFINKMFSALKIPKAYLNYSDELNGKSTLSGLSLSWSRQIEYIQRLTVSQLQKIAQVHLTLLGYEDSDLANFDITLARPSILHEQERIALLKEKVDLANQMQEKNFISTDWIYDNIFQMSEDQINRERDLIAEDVKRKFRYTQIEQEGNDPALSGVSYGTPHDLASIYKNNASGPESVPDGYDEKKVIGRPVLHASSYGTDSSFAGRDPFGKKEMRDKYKKDSLKPNPRKGIYNEGLKKSDLEKIKPGKKIQLFESEQPKDLSVLDEGNLLDKD